MVPIVCLCLVQENGHDVSAPAAEEPKLQADLQICGQQLQYNCRQNRFTSLSYILSYIYIIYTVITCNMYGHKISLIFVIIFHRSGVSLTLSLSLAFRNDLPSHETKPSQGRQGNNWIITPISRAYGRYIYTYTYHSHIVYKPTNITGRAIIG